jgi:hypothetical protein
MKKASEAENRSEAVWWFYQSESRPAIVWAAWAGPAIEA